MTFWLAVSFLALGYLLRMAHARPRRFADVDALITKQRDTQRAGTRDV